MVDTLVDGAVQSSIAERHGCWGPYYINPTTAVEVFIDSSSDVSFRRTTTAGVSFSKTVIDTGNTMRIACWFDQETPGDTGTLIHVMWLDEAVSDVNYITIDVSDGSLGTQRLIDGSVTISTGNSENRCCITKGRNGNLYVGWSTTTEFEFVRSVDAGVTWVDRADVYEGALDEDWVLLFAANTGFGEDIAAFFWDRTSNEITVKMYDDSANTWTETLILASMFEDGSHISMDGSIRHSDGFIMGFAHSDEDSAGDDGRTFIVNPNSIASPGIDVSTANVFTNQAESSQGFVFVNQQNDDTYIGYMKGGTWLSSVDVVFHKSLDGMASWEAEEPYSQNASDDFRRVQAGRTVGNNGGIFQPIFSNDDLEDLFLNLVNDVEIAAAAPAAGGAELRGGNASKLMSAGFI